jgi:hypothetical protein
MEEGGWRREDGRWWREEGGMGKDREDLKG